MACGRACGGRGRSVLKQQETRHDPAWPGIIHHSLWQEPTRYTSPLHPALLVVIGLMSFVTPSEAEYSESPIRFPPMPARNKHGVNVHLLSHHLISSLNDVAPCVTAVRTRDRQMSLRVPNHVRQCWHLACLMLGREPSLDAEKLKGRHGKTQGHVAAFQPPRSPVHPSIQLLLLQAPALTQPCPSLSLLQTADRSRATYQIPMEPKFHHDTSDGDPLIGHDSKAKISRLGPRRLLVLWLISVALFIALVRLHIKTQSLPIQCAWKHSEFCNCFPV